MSKEAVPSAPSYQREDRVFTPLSPQHPASVRRREVHRFRRGDGTHGRRAWNPSTQDTLHPFPQPALLHTTACYNGVDVVASHFPETVKGSGFLRVPGCAQPGVWTRNRAIAATAATRHTYRCEALEEPEAARSYLAQVIVEDAQPERKTLRDGWCASTSLDGAQRNRFVAPAPEDSSHHAAHTALNETLTATASGGYVAPYRRVKELNKARAEQQQLRRMAETETLETLYDTRSGPSVFKLSNADQWWDMDPVAVTRAMTDQVEQIKSNPYSTTFRRTPSMTQTRTVHF